jgi:hypothetical protein
LTQYMARVHVLSPTQGEITGHSTRFAWQDGFLLQESIRGERVLIGVFPTRQQPGGTVYGGSPLMGAVLQAMHLWDLPQEVAIWLMHEDSD